VIKEQQELPEDWSYKELGKAVDVILGQSPASSTYNFDGEGLPFFQGKTEFTDLYPEVRKWCRSPKKIAQKDDVLVSVRAPVGPTNLAPSECAIGRGLAALRVSEGQDKKYYLYLVRRFQNELASLGTGTTFEAISGAVLKGFKVPVAPPAQQKQIVAKIEELFSHIDAGIEGLKKSKALLKQYRQSVLKAAVTGDLTKDWREQNANAEQGCSNVAGGTTPGATKIEPANQLLKRIQTERRQRWEQQKRNEFQAKGKPPKNDKWKEKYEEPELGIIEDWTIPESWEIVRAEFICEFITKGTTPKKDRLRPSVGEIPFLKVYNLTFDTILDFSVDPTFTDIETHKGFLARSKVYPGDVLMNIVGPPLGKVSVVPNSFDEWNINQAISVYRPIIFNNQLLAYYLLSQPVLDWMKSKTKTTAGQVNLTLEICRNTPITVPPLAEQKEIVQRVEGKLTSADRLMTELDVKLTQAQQQKQTILASAFSGKLI